MPLRVFVHAAARRALPAIPVGRNLRHAIVRADWVVGYLAGRLGYRWPGPFAPVPRRGDGDWALVRRAAAAVLAHQPRLYEPPPPLGPPGARRRPRWWTDWLRLDDDPAMPPRAPITRDQEIVWLILEGALGVLVENVRVLAAALGPGPAAELLAAAASAHGYRPASGRHARVEMGWGHDLTGAGLPEPVAWVLLVDDLAVAHQIVTGLDPSWERRGPWVRAGLLWVTWRIGSAGLRRRPGLLAHPPDVTAVPGPDRALPAAARAAVVRLLSGEPPRGPAAAPDRRAAAAAIRAALARGPGSPPDPSAPPAADTARTA